MENIRVKIYCRSRYKFFWKILKWGLLSFSCLGLSEQKDSLLKILICCFEGALHSGIFSIQIVSTNFKAFLRFKEIKTTVLAPVNNS